MRARRREINIFNMSLLDILCGALGAFCFMMLVALPYYKAPEKKLREAQEETNKLLRDIEKMKDTMKDQQAVEDLSALVRRLEAQVKLLQGEVNQLSAENQELKERVAKLDTQNKQLQAQNDQLQAEKKKLQDDNEALNQTLNQRQPFVVLSSTGSAGETARIYLADNRIMSGKTEPANPVFNPDFSQGSGWSGDRVGSFPGEGVFFWICGALTPESVFKVYVRNDAPDWGRRTFTVRTALFGNLANNTAFQMMPGVTLTRERYWAFLGTIKIDENYHPFFTPAMPAEQEAEWRRLSKAPPNAAPSPTPGGRAAATASQATAVPADAPAVRREFEEALRELNAAMSSSGPGTEERRTKAIQRFEVIQKKMQDLRRQYLPRPTETADPWQKMIDELKQQPPRPQDRQTAPNLSPSVSP